MITIDKKVVSRIVFIAVLIIVIIITGLYFYNIFMWADYPDFGFGFRSATGIDVVGVISDHGRRAGLILGDRFLEVNGKPFSNIKEFRAAMRRDLGEQNTYLVERDGEKFFITISVIPKGLKRSFSESGFLCLLGLCYILIGTLVFLMKPHQRTSWIFYIFSITVGLFFTYLYTAGEMTPFWLETVNTLNYTLIPAVFIHLAFSFPEERHLIRKYPYFSFLPYVISIILFICVRYTTPTILDTPKTLVIFIVSYMVLGVLLFLGSCLQLWLKSQSEMVKLRSKIILLGFAISASVPLIDLVSSTLFHLYLLPSYNLYLPFFIVFPLFIGYSIVKHDLFDIDAIIKRTYGYVLTTVAIAGIYGLFVFLSNLAFGRFEITNSPMFPLIFILGVIFLFNPVRNRLQRFIDRVFYRLEYDYQETVQRISETMRSLLSLNEIGKSIMDIALGVMFIDSGCLLLLNRKKQEYECLTLAGKREICQGRRGEKENTTIEKGQGKGDSGQDGQTFLDIKEVKTGEIEVRATLRPNGGEGDSQLSELKLSVDAPLIQKIAERKKEVTIYDIQEDPLYEKEKAAYQKIFDQLKATLVIPLIYEDRLTGLISLGEKKSGKFYRREDINLLKTLANQGAVAIENALLLEEVIEKERMEEELSIARDLQTSMLPATCPKVKGFEIAALSIPAREVGGDFFDFIDIGEDRLGLVIGDVTGKSVSGALIMAASRSVFRMLSEEKSDVSSIMIRANQRLKKDVKKNMFVALLYAILDINNRTLSLCNAGQMPPIYLSKKTGKADFVKTEGDTFPLGIIEKVEYQDTSIQFQEGDRVVFCTDGIVEALNNQNKMFSFERLLKVVQESKSLTAEALLKDIIDSVEEFTGDTAQYDDMTIIVLQVAESKP